MSLLKLLIGYSVLVASFQVFAHGEDKPGPHGGFIRMPGAFHTEVRWAASHQLKVYLLDMNWKNPTVKDSQVEAVVKSDKSVAAQCRAEKDHFTCEFPKGTKVDSGQLEIQATREKMKGNVASYSLPLKLGAEDPHQGHH